MDSIELQERTNSVISEKDILAKFMLMGDLNFLGSAIEEKIG